MIRSIELLAPARDLATGRVAVDCGADAVYIGGPGFGARRAAGNSLEDIAALVRYARPFGVRVYATLNTILFDNELAEAEAVARGVVAAGVDALIVQDMAWLRMDINGANSQKGSAVDVPVEFHASTQTSNITPEDVAFLGHAGFARVILERALSLDRIRAIRAACAEKTELEVFVHGAICVGYSGRCFMSRSMGGANSADGAVRSGNRGDCSQPCRLAYDLVDGQGHILLKSKHLLSVCDLDLSARLGELLDAGVSSFKVEGRLKDATYVRNVVSHYRRLLDEAISSRPTLGRASVGISEPDFTPNPAKSFTRGRGNCLSTGLRTSSGTAEAARKGGAFARVETEYYFDGPVRGAAFFDTPKAIGEPLGRVGKVGCERTGNRYFVLENYAGELAAGDGICFFVNEKLRGTNINRLEGGRVYPDKCEGIEAGTEIYRNYDRAFVRALECSRMKRRIVAGARVTMNPSHVEIVFTDRTGLSATVVQRGVFEVALDPEKMADVVRKQLSRSGDTIFEVRDVEISGEVLFVPVSTLAHMRRRGLESLFTARASLKPKRNPATEDTSARFPRTHLTCAENVTNRLSEGFYRDHGVTEIEPALELHGVAPGGEVMRTRYCLRREIGECLKEGSGLREDLWLERGDTRWRLVFDCEKCEMAVATATGLSVRPRSKNDEVKLSGLNKKR